MMKHELLCPYNLIREKKFLNLVIGNIDIWKNSLFAILFYFLQNASLS